MIGRWKNRIETMMKGFLELEMVCTDNGIRSTAFDQNTLRGGGLVDSRQLALRPLSCLFSELFSSSC